uniref:Phytocyanin domain-containing protein n=1 Tax=Leersia perrieri TaxID=77586 RepID=A0A0D9VED8_9ORYZ
MPGGSATALGLLLLLSLWCVVHSEEWIVGGNLGWGFAVTGWEKGKLFQPGDVLVFKYEPKYHNVVEVDRAGYDGCTVSGPAKVHDSGDDRIELNGGEAFFISSVRRHHPCNLNNLGFSIAVVCPGLWLFTHS